VWSELEMKWVRQVLPLEWLEPVGGLASTNPVMQFQELPPPELQRSVRPPELALGSMASAQPWKESVEWPPSANPAR